MKIEIPEKKNLVYEMVFKVRWGDMDVMGHMNNTMYFRYLETARMDWFKSIGVEGDPKVPGPVLANAFCNFYRQLAYPDEVLLRLYACDPGRSSFHTWGLMTRVGEPDILCAAGGGTLVWADVRTGKSVPLPDWVRQLAQ
jgi:acyl-CoA thioester hydrolase